MHDISRQVAEQSFVVMSKSERISRLMTLIDEADKLDKEGKILESRMHKNGIYTKLMNVHQNQIKNLSPNSTLQKLFDQKNKIKIQVEINNILKEIHQWSLKGYKVIVQTRQTVTGQELIYHIQDTDHKIVKILNEEQFLSLLESNNIGLNYANWEKIKEASSRGVPKLDLLKLNVQATKKNLNKIAETAPTINLKRDALYKYLVDNKAISRAFTKTDKDSGEEVSTEYSYHARLSELHSQLLARYRWMYNKEGGVSSPKKGKGDKTGFFFSENRRKLVDAFVNIYKKEGLHKDTDAFYQVGDAVLDEKTLIENKVGNAVVSVSTIKHAVAAIASLKGATTEKMKQTFLNLFTKDPKTGTYLTKKIQEGAYKKAVKEISELLKT